LGITDEEAAKMNVDAAVKSASKDGEISEDEEQSIKEAAEKAGVDSEKAIKDAKSKAKKGKK
jgi:tellurite resistance protein